MVDPVSAVAIAGTLLSAYGSYKAGKTSKEASERQQALLNRQAEEVMARMYINDDLTKKQGRRLVGAQRVARAGQGIDIGVGSSLDIIEDTIIEINDERLRNMRDAVFEANMIAEGAKLEGEYGRDAYKAGIIGGAGTLLTSGYRMSKAGVFDSFGGGASPSPTIAHGGMSSGSFSLGSARPSQSIYMK